VSFESFALQLSEIRIVYSELCFEFTVVTGPEGDVSIINALRNTFTVLRNKPPVFGTTLVNFGLVSLTHSTLFSRKYVLRGSKIA
jgi:hypothetical protein